MLSSLRTRYWLDSNPNLQNVNLGNFLLLTAVLWIRIRMDPDPAKSERAYK